MGVRACLQAGFGEQGGPKSWIRDEAPVKIKTSLISDVQVNLQFQLIFFRTLKDNSFTTLY